MKRHAALTFLCLLLPGCWTVDHADLREISAKYDLELSESDVAEDEVIALGSIQVAKGGFYLFGYLPIVRIGLHETIDRVAREAKEMGADGVCDIRYTYSPAHPLKFMVFPVPDWSAEIQVFGMAYKWRTRPRPARPGRGDSGTR